MHKIELQKLLVHCPNCGTDCTYEISKPIGSKISVTFNCEKCPKEPKWDSQPSVGDVIKNVKLEKWIKQRATYTKSTYDFSKFKYSRIPSGNLDLSASICFSGVSPNDTIRVLKQAGIQTMSNTSYFNYQKKYLHPTVYENWRWQQEVHFDEVRRVTNGIGLMVLGGDARCDTPGKCAKFGTYSTMELDLNKVTDIKVVQVCAYKYTYIIYVYIIYTCILYNILHKL